MNLHSAYQIDGKPVFGTFGGSNLAELEAARDAGMNLVITGGDVLDTSTDLGRFCLENGIKVMYGLAGQIHGRPRLTRAITATEIDIPIADGRPPEGSNLIQIDDELIRYSEATGTELLGCKRGAEGTVAAEHESAIILFWPELAAEQVRKVKDSPNLWGYWVLDDSPGYTLSANKALYRVVQEVDGDHAVCAGHSGVGTLRNFAPGTCDILAFYYYPFCAEGYLRTLNTVSAQWTLAGARALVPGIPFIGIYQGFWERESSERGVNSTEPMEPWMIREQVEDFVRDGAAGIAGYAVMTGNGTFHGWNDSTDIVEELRAIGGEIASTGALSIPPEPEELASARVQPQGHWETPQPIAGIVPAWHLIGPFDAGNEGLAATFPPESEFDLNARYAGKGTDAAWKTQAATMGAVGLVETFGSPHFFESSTAYAVCTVTSPVEQAVQMRFGSDDDGVVWFNDEEVWRHEGGRGVVPDSDVVPVTLPAGETRILVKAHNRVDQWGLFMRFTDLNGEPLDGLSFSPEAP